MILQKTNRRRSMSARKMGLEAMWCPRCDAAVVGDYGKCGNCGYVNKQKKKVPKLDNLDKLLEG